MLSSPTPAVDVKGVELKKEQKEEERELKEERKEKQEEREKNLEDAENKLYIIHYIYNAL